MKKLQRDHISSMDEVEDLTLFANESFDTGDVDLFEFTSEESSPLTRLKSIILSLDWEINDEILQELEDELDNLKSMWREDKVAEVYLQGLSKIGNYIRTKGAYAHPNSIKLLLTFFSDFEKIISSTQITGDEITQLLKGDVRKFKILQYQINQSEATEAKTSDIAADLGPTGISVALSGTMTDQETCKQLKAAILSLDWEVTNESLRQYKLRIDAFKTQMTDNKPALVLIQGLQALGDYIADERADAHPESFILLHSFSDALEELTKAGDQQPSQDTIQDILIDRINRLNNLKMLVANPQNGKVDAQKLDLVFEELDTASTETAPAQAAAAPIVTEPAPAETALSKAADAATETLATEHGALFVAEAMPAMESAGVQYPDEVLPPDAIHPVDDELADDFIESHLSSNRGLQPALSNASETAGFDAGAEPLDNPIQSDLADQLDFLFADTGDEHEPEVTLSALDTEELPLPLEGGDQSPAALTKNEEPEHDLVVAALSDVESPPMADEPTLAPGSAAEETDFGSLDIQSKLDSFFAEADEEQDETDAIPPALAAENEPAAALSDVAVLADQEEDQGESLTMDEADLGSMEILNKLDSFFAEADEEQDETDAIPPALAAENEPAAALSDVAVLADQEEEDQGESLAMDDADLGSMEILNKLDSFFTDADEGPSEPVEVLATEVEEIEQTLFFNETDKLQTALADSGEEQGFSEEVEIAALSFTPMDEIEEKLDLFFGNDDEEDVLLADSLTESLGFDMADDLDARQPVALEVEAGEKQAAAPFEIDELTMALEASIDGDQPPAMDAAESTKIQLAALGTLLPLVVRAPSHDNLAESAAMIATCKQADLTPGQHSLIQLLESTLTLLVRLPTKDHAATEKLVNYLYQRLTAGEPQADVLAEAIGRFTAWLQEAGKIMPVVPAASEPQQQGEYAYTAKELYFELSELRSYMHKEFSKLQHEIQHHK